MSNTASAPRSDKTPEQLHDEFRARLIAIVDEFGYSDRLAARLYELAADHRRLVKLLSDAQQTDVHRDGNLYVNGWLAGYLEAGGSSTDEYLATKASQAWEHRHHLPPIPDRVAVQLDEVIDAAARMSDDRDNTGLQPG